MDQGGGKRRVGIEKSPNRLAAGASWGEGGLIPLQKAAWATFVNIWYRNGGGISAFCDLRRQTTAAGSGGRSWVRVCRKHKIRDQQSAPAVIKIALAESAP